MAKLKDIRPHVIVVEGEPFQRATQIDFRGEKRYRPPGGEDGFALARFLRQRSRKLGIILLLETTSHREMEVFDRAIDIRILRIRRKIEADPAHPTSIRTVRSAGYMFVPPED